MAQSKPQYRFVVAGPDLMWWLGYGFPTLGRSIGELTPQSCTMSWGLNKPGTLTMEVQKREDEMFASRVLGPAWPGPLQPGAVTLWVVRDAVPICGGFIWDISSSGASDTLNVNCEDFTGYYNRITLSSNFSLAQNTVGNILKSLL